MRKPFCSFAINYVAIFLIVVITLSCSCGYSISYTRHDKHARILYDLGLYEGVSSRQYEADLSATVSREMGITLLLKVFGKKEEALALSNKEARSILSEFTDRYTLSDWSEKYVAYAIKTEMINGVTGDSLSPKQTIDGKTYATMILRNLGYDIPKEKWDIAAYILAYKEGLSAKQAKEFNDKFLIKDDLVAISFRALGAKNSKDNYLIEELINSKIVSEELASQLKLVKRVDNRLLPDEILDFSMELDFNRQRLILNDGTLYDGEVQYGKANGYGTFEYPGQLKYTGEVKDNKKNGKGIHIWPNGDRYEGEFVEDSMTGFGSFMWASGDKYQGQWTNGAFNGNGTFTWKSGDQYSGEWRSGKFDGYGTFKWIDGSIYSGYWKNGDKEGKGTYIDSQGNEQNGFWSAGKFVGQNQ